MKHVFLCGAPSRVAIAFTIWAVFATGTCAAATVKLNTSASPSSGIAGLSDVWVTGSGFPGTPVPATTNVVITASCGGAPLATTVAHGETSVFDGTDRVEFLIPAAVPTGSYFVSISGTATGGAFTSSNCSLLQVTATNTVLESCIAGSAIGIISPAAIPGTTVPVTAYVPNGPRGQTGIQVVPIEGAGSLGTDLVREAFVSACSANSATEQVVCVDNGESAGTAGTGVYVIDGYFGGATVLTSGASARVGFSAEVCVNCGVAVNAAAGTAGQAVIQMGLSGSPSGSGLQFLDLATLTLGEPIPTANRVGLAILWDPFTGFVLNPDESGNYDLVQVTGIGIPGTVGGPIVAEYNNAVSVGNGYLGSAGEDCETGIAIATSEGTGYLYLTDLKQISKTPGTPGTWTAASNTQYFPEFAGLVGGTSAVAVAPGSTHLGVVAGEFSPAVGVGGLPNSNLVGFIQLPATSGSGMPAVVDYVLAAMPNGFQLGGEPYTTTAYTSPNTGKAYAVLGDPFGGYLAVVDIAAIIAAPRVTNGYPTAHTVDPTYDLIAQGVVRYVSTSP